MGGASRIARPKAARAIHLQLLAALTVVMGATANALSAELAQKRDVAACQALDATIRRTHGGIDRLLGRRAVVEGWFSRSGVHAWR